MGSMNRVFSYNYILLVKSLKYLYLTCLILNVYLDIHCNYMNVRGLY